MTVELGLTPDGRWEIDTLGLVEAARQAGFSTLGVGADRVDDETAALFGVAGLRCHELLALVLSDDEPATLATAAGLAEKAARVGARWVLTTFRTGLTDRTAVVIERCAAIFAACGAGMAVEFSPLGPVASIESGLEIVAVAGSDRAGLVIDSWHFCYGENTWEDLGRVPLEQIAYVQFADALAPASDNPMHETRHRRAMPGDGVLDLDRFAATLLERRWDGVVSVEVLSRDLGALPVPEFARVAFDSAARYWS